MKSVQEKPRIISTDMLCVPYYNPEENMEGHTYVKTLMHKLSL